MRLRRLLSLAGVPIVFVLSVATQLAAAPAVPTPLSPSNGATVTVPFTISWSATLNPGEINAGYNWQVSRSSSFSPLILMGSTNPGSTEDVISGLTGGTYFWRVQAVDSSGGSVWSQAQSVVVNGVGAGTPGTPVLAPTRGYATFHPWESIHFDWTASPDAVTYRVEVSNDPTFPLGPVPAGTQTFWFDNVSTNSFEYVHTIVGNWFARVFAVNADNPQNSVRSLPSNVVRFSSFFDNSIGPAPVLVSPLNDPMLTLPVTLTWAHVPNPQAMGYVLEVARDAGFTDIEWFFNQYTEPSVVMLSLTSGQKFWRVLSQQGLSSPTTNADTDWSSTGRFTINSAPSTPVSIAPLGNPDMFMYSGGSGMVALQLTAGVPAAGASIPLTSSHPALAPLPATLSMPGTHAWAQFPLTVGQVTAPTLVTLTATFNGVTASSQFTIRPPTLNDDILQAAPTRATGGGAMTGWVDLKGSGLAGPAGFDVMLSTDSPAASVPATVTIPAGVNGTSFPIQTSPVTSTTVVTISATNGGVTTRWPITLTPEPAPTSFCVRPMSTTNGSQGVVTTAEGVGHDQLLHVESSDPSLATVPASFTVAAVSGIGRFDVTTVPVTAPTTVTIRVSGGGVTLSHPVTLYPSLPALTGFTLTPASVVGGIPSTATVTLASPAPSVGVAINVETSLPLAASVPKSVTIPGGATSASFTVKTFPVDTTTAQLIASLDNVFQASAITVTRPAPAPSLSAASVNPTSVAAGRSSTGTVTLSAPAPNSGAVVSLSDDSSATTVPTSVTVPAGSSSANFTITTTAITASTTVTISAVFGGVTRTATLTVTPTAPAAPSLMSPPNGATPAQPVTLDWTNVPNATSYEVQVDDTSTMAAPFVANPVVTAPSVTLTGLPVRQLWWRVRARNAAGVFGPFSSTRRFTPQASTPSTPTLSGVSMNPATVVGGDTVSGTATLTAAAPSGGALVSFSSSNTAVAPVPANVTIAAGTTSGTFTIATSSVAAPTSVTISATYEGVTKAAALTVTPPSQLATLTVTASGRSGERVTSNPAGINVNVGSTGSASFNTGTSITLSVTNGRDAIWSGACSTGGNKTKACTFTLGGTATVTANVQ
jgi:hypothetical protein